VALRAQGCGAYGLRRVCRLLRDGEGRAGLQSPWALAEGNTTRGKYAHRPFEASGACRRWRRNTTDGESKHGWGRREQPLDDRLDRPALRVG
jgi:hypothetical protein